MSDPIVFWIVTSFAVVGWGMAIWAHRRIDDLAAALNAFGGE